jgi:hypothetical protein
MSFGALYFLYNTTCNKDKYKEKCHVHQLFSNSATKPMSMIYKTYHASRFLPELSKFVKL